MTGDRAQDAVGTSHADCDNPRCAYGYDPQVGMDHWVEITEHDTDELTKWGYCSRKCMLDHQQKVLEQ